MTNRERPLLFSAPMVNAILSGGKKQTRRVVKMKRNPVNGMKNIMPDITECPYGVVGDHFWVREAWQAYKQTNYEYDEWDEAQSTKDVVQGLHTIVYRADEKNHPERWFPSIHMPRWASRIDLKITRVRVQRLQDISDPDAHDEGVEYHKTGDLYEGDLSYHYKDYMCKGLEADDDGEKIIYNNTFWDDPVSSFKSLWQAINGVESWDENPWVWVIDFERIKP